MTEDEARIQQHQGGPHLAGSPSQKPYWKRMHHSRFFWVSVFFILVAMGIFIITDGFFFRPTILPEPTATRARGQ
jgi:hypothetical protein